MQHSDASLRVHIHQLPCQCSAYQLLLSPLGLEISSYHDLMEHDSFISLPTSDVTQFKEHTVIITILWHCQIFKVISKTLP